MIKTAIMHMPTVVKIDIIDISLLAVDEAIELPEEIREYSKWWWLRSPGYDSHYAAIVYHVGSVNDRGLDVNLSFGAVRPALTISNLEAFGLSLGDLIEIQGKKYIVIPGNKALYNDKPVFHRFDSATNNYLDAEIKGIVDNWFKEEEKGIDSRDREEVKKAIFEKAYDMRFDWVEQAVDSVPTHTRANEMTNYERIKNMTLEEMGRFLYLIREEGIPCSDFGEGDCDGDCECCLTEWLKKENEND